MSICSDLFHIGLLVPASNIVMEDELHSLLVNSESHKRVRFHTSRLSFITRYSSDPQKYLLELCQSVPSAIGHLSLIPVSILCFGCTSAELLFGSMIKEYQGKYCKFLTPIDSIADVLKYYSLHNPLIISPYTNTNHLLALSVFNSYGIDSSVHINKDIRNKEKLIEYSTTCMSSDNSDKLILKVKT